MVLVVPDAVDENQTPQYNERFDAVGESVGLEGPGNVGGCDESDGDSPVSRRRNELMYSPVLKHKAQQEHHDAQSVEGDGGRHLAIPQALPKPFEDCERDSVDEPEREEAPNGRGRVEFPSLVCWPAIYCALGVSVSVWW